MAVETLVAAGLTNEAATPAVRNTSGKDGAPAFLKTVAAVITPSASQSATSVNKLFRVPSNAIPKSLKVWAADDASGKWAFGLLAIDGTTVVDDNHLGHCDFGEGPFIGTEKLYTDSTGGLAGTVGVADMDKPLWQTLGLSEDPGVEYIVYGRTFEAFDATPPAIRTELQYADQS